MNEPENELAKASAENGTFDPRKAKQIAAAAVSQFQTRLKKVERIAWIYLVGCTAVTALAGVQLWFASSTKAMIFFALLILVAFETTILIKLWYWVVNGKLSVLRELKTLQLHSAHPSSASASSFAVEPNEAETSFRHPGVSRGERFLWCIALALIGATAGYYIGAHNGISKMITTESITLKADGSVTVVTKESYQAPYVLGSFPRTFGKPETLKTVRWFDDRGRELPFDVTTANNQRNYVVHFIEPAMPGEWVSSTQIYECASMATKTDDLWTFQWGFQHGFERSEYLGTVELPPGAQLVTAEPQPDERWTADGIERLTYRATRYDLVPFNFKIQYRLRDEAEKPGS
jgi:hypothetical protein